MLAIFCLRLACGLVGSLLLVSPVQVNPRFYRIHFLSALGLVALTAACAPDLALENSLGFWVALGGSILLAFLGSLVWSLEKAPAGRTLIALTALSLVAALGMAKAAVASDQRWDWVMVNELSAAALLGTATTAMLLGHSYLIAPAMSLTPLLRLLGALFAAILLRGVIAGIFLGRWTAGHSLANLDDVTMLLPLRWGLGVLLPLVLVMMAWHTARIRSTQSATGILYVVVILTFLGELMSQLLFRMTAGSIL